MSGTSLNQNGATDTIYISQVNENFYYNINNGINSQLTFPVNITNINTLYTLKVIFTTDLTLNNTNQYFRCQSDGIQFGDSTLNSDGSIRTINIINGANNYDGFIENGSEITNGNNNIYIYNLYINGFEYSSQISAGWIGKKFFGNGASNNYIINCTSIGDIYGGGIVGDSAQNITIIGCYSEGTINPYCGGIIGSSSSNIIIQESFSTGAHSDSNSSGIFGTQTVYSLASNCYSISTIPDNGGGIFGIQCTNNQAVNCYSVGAIFGGGIFGTTTSFDNAINCYSIGSIAGVGDGAGGIFGVYYDSETSIAIHCYTSGSSSLNKGGIYQNSTTDGVNNYGEANHDNSGIWNDTHARSVLLNDNTWISLVNSTPFILANIGYTPYSRSNVIYINNTPTFNKQYTATITAGDSIYSVLQNRNNTYLLVNNNEPTIQIISTTGRITTTSNTPADIYTFNVFCCPTTVYNAGPPYYNYSVTSVNLTVLAQPSPPPPEPIPIPPPTVLFPNSQPYCPPIRSSGTVQLQSTYIASKQSSYILNINGTNSCTQQVFNSNIASNIYFNPPVGPITITNCGQQVVGSNAYLNITTRPKTQSQRIAAVQAATLLNQPRFASYNRWNPLPACPPLPALANSAGEAKPSLNTCLPNKNATLASM